MDKLTFRALITAAWLCSLVVVGTAGCGDDEPAADLAMPLDLSAPVYDLTAVMDLSVPNGDGGLLNADGGGHCGATFNYMTRFVAGRTCSANTGGANGASCTTSADCAEVCCTCAGNTNMYMVALCSDHACNPDWACLCTDVPAKLKADNICP